MSQLFRTKFTACLILLILSFLFIYLPAPAHARTIKVGAQNNPPLVYMDTDGNFKGFSIDVLEQIAAIEGWDLEYVPCAFSKCLEMLEIARGLTYVH